MASERPFEVEPGTVLSAQAPDGRSVCFDVTRKLGGGGEGSIYEAVADDGQFAIVKGPHWVGKRDLALEREAAHLARVSPHPNVVRLLATLKDPRGHSLLILERVFENPHRVLNRDAVRARLATRDKAHLEKLPKRAAALGKRLACPPPAIALELGYEVALGIEHLHAKGLVHGDVKPANVMVALDWREPEIPDRAYFERIAKGRWRGLVIDLGGSRTMKELDALARGVPLVKPPSLTPIYAPPEIIPGAIDATTGAERSRFGPAMDVYAFGLTLYQFLTGYLPYGHLKTPPDEKKLEEIAHAKREERDGAHRPIARSALDAIDWSDTAVESAVTSTERTAFLEELWAILAQATHVEPARRGRMGDLRAALGRLLGVEEIGVERARSLRDSGADDERSVRPWVQKRLRLDAFSSRLVDAGRDGSTEKQDPKTRRIQRRGDDFWEMQGFAPK